MAAWQKIRTSFYGRHSHSHAYAALILSGSYEEAGDHGRFRAGPGEVILHERFEAHINRFAGSGAVVLNLPLPPGASFQPGHAALAEPDAIVRLAETSQPLAVQELLAGQMPSPSASACLDWPDQLAADLIRSPALPLARWAHSHALTPWAVSRGFLPAIEGLLGTPLASDAIVVYLLNYSEPHGIRITGLRFLTHVKYPFRIVLHNAIHESMHPPYNNDDPDIRNAVAVLGRDPLIADRIQRHVRHHLQLIWRFTWKASGVLAFA